MQDAKTAARVGAGEDQSGLLVLQKRCSGKVVSATARHVPPGKPLGRDRLAIFATSHP